MCHHIFDFRTLEPIHATFQTEKGDLCQNDAIFASFLPHFYLVFEKNRCDTLPVPSHRLTLAHLVNPDRIPIISALFAPFLEIFSYLFAIHQALTKNHLLLGAVSITTSSINFKMFQTRPKFIIASLWFCVTVTLGNSLRGREFLNEFRAYA